MDVDDCYMGLAAWLSSGRAALFHALTGLAQGCEVLLPEYLCWASMTGPVEAHGLSPAYYPIGGDLSIDPDTLYRRITPRVGAVVLVHHYGLIRHVQLSRRLKERFPKCRVIIDASHDPYFLCDYGRQRQGAQVVVCSLFKFFALPGGGLIRSTIPLEINVPNTPQVEGQALALAAAVLKHAYVEHLAEHTLTDLEEIYLSLFQRYREARAADVSGGGRMSPLTAQLLARVPMAEVAERRRLNYDLIADLLGTCHHVHPICPTRPDEAVPWCLPLRVQSRYARNSLRFALMEQRIYCPDTWSQKGITHPLDKEAYSHYDRTLHVVTDHRYSKQHMERQAYCLIRAASTLR